MMDNQKTQLRQKRKSTLTSLLTIVVLVIVAVVSVILNTENGINKLSANRAINANAQSKTIYPIALQTWSYSYSGTYKTLTIPTSGYYKLEAWGSKGSDGYTRTNASSEIGICYGGKGAYATGTVYLNAGTILYIYVGGRSGSEAGGYNGGGAATKYNWLSGIVMPGGGGASDIRIGGTSLYRRAVVAAGGAGGGQFNTWALGGEETSFGAFPAGQSYAGQGGSFGQGGTATRIRAQNNSHYLVGGGGGGWYGGGANNNVNADSSKRI